MLARMGYCLGVIVQPGFCLCEDCVPLLGSTMGMPVYRLPGRQLSRTLSTKEVDMEIHQTLVVGR